MNKYPVRFRPWLNVFLSALLLASLLILTTSQVSSSRVAVAYPLDYTQIGPVGSGPDTGWTTFLGGTGADHCYKIAIDDDSGNIYVIGTTHYAGWGTPIRAFAGIPDGSDAFVAKLSSSGVLQWNTFLGGAGYDYGQGIALDNSGNVYVSGYSTAAWQGATPPKRAYTAGSDLFVASLDSDGNLQWNTFLGGNGKEEGGAITVFGNMDIYVGGECDTSWGAPVRSFSGYKDAFSARLDSNGNLVWNTFLGGTGYDLEHAIATDGSGNVYVCGESQTGWQGSAPPLSVPTGYGSMAFIAKISPDGVLLWNSLPSGIIRGIVLDSADNIFVVGDGAITWQGVPPVNAPTGSQDAFAAKLDAAGTLIWHTFLGSNASEYGFAVTVDSLGNVYVGGNSEATWGSPFRGYSGCGDVFAAKLDAGGNLVWNTFLGGTSIDYCHGILVDDNGYVYLAGGSYATWGTPVRAYTNDCDALVVKIDQGGTLGLPEINLKQGSNNIASGGTCDFGAKVVASAASLTIQIENLGDAGLNLNTPLSISGAYAGEFSLLSQPDPTVAVAGNTTFIVRFTPSAIGPKTASITLTNNDSDEGSYILNLSGLGISASSTSTWNTFLGGEKEDVGFAIALDANGGVYLCGSSEAAWGNPVRAFFSSSRDIFVARLDNTGNLIWNTFLGGRGSDDGYDVAVDNNGNVYVIGVCGTSWGKPLKAFAGHLDTFVAKLNNHGVLQWNTFLGNYMDEGHGIAVDSLGNIYVCGSSFAAWGSPVRPFSSGYYDALVAKLDTNGNLQWHTFLGGNGYDYGRDIAINGNGNIYVSGYGTDTWGSPLRAFSGGYYDAFVAKLDNNGALQWNTFLGGNDSDKGNGVAVDSGGNVYAGGDSQADWGTPLRPFSGDGIHVFAAKLDDKGNLVWNTFLGGLSSDIGGAIASDSHGNLLVGGASWATWGSPIRAFTPAPDADTGAQDAFVAKLDNSGSLQWNTFLGGNGYQEVRGIALDGGGNIFVDGNSDATWSYPVQAFAGTSDAFAAKLNSSGALTNDPAGPVISSLLANAVVSVPYSQTLVVAGGKSPYTQSIKSGSLPPGLSLTSNGKVTGIPAKAGKFNITISVTDSSFPAKTSSKAFTVSVLSRGDANGDGVVNMGDVTILEKIILGLDPMTAAADFNNDGTVSIGDVTSLERFLLGLK